MAETIAQYKILKTLGEGAMGVVYLCHDERLRRDLAVKVLSEKYSQDPTYRQRFLTEARSASALNHPNIITIYEIGTDGDRDYIAMEYVQGQSLQALISERGPLPVADLLAIGIQLAKGLAAAHRAGVVHRDLKPANVIITPDGQVKILDFGLARQQAGLAALAAEGTASTEAPTVAASYTQPGMILGTPGYMAPEQARGGQADHRSDQFALGCMLHAMASGTAPFSGESVIDILHSVLHGSPPTLAGVRSDLPSDFESVLQRCLQKDPDQRFTDSAEIERALRGVQEALGTPSQLRPAPGPPPGRAAPRWRWALLAGVVVILVAAGFVLLRGGLPTGAATVTVSVQDEEGHQIERELPAAEHRKRVAIFPFELAAEDSTHIWLAFAVSEVLGWDLLQDYLIHVDMLRDLLGGSRFAMEARKTGHDRVIDAPLALRRQVAERSNCTHLITGRVASDSSGIDLLVELHVVRTGTELARFELAGPDLLPLLDEASLRIRTVLGIPEDHRREWPDLPASDLATSSPAALKLFARSVMARDIDHDLEAAGDLLEQAVAVDPTFAMAYWQLYYVYQYVEPTDPSRPAELLSALMSHTYRLPERVQFGVKAAYFQNQGESDKMLAVLEMWAELYPQDSMPLETLLLVYLARDDAERIADTLKKLLALDPDNSEYLLQAGAQFQRLGDFEAAREAFESYIADRPEDSQARRALGELLQVLGDHEEARKQYEQALLITPADPATRLALAKCEFDLGDLEAWPNALRAILKESLGADERAQMQLELASYHEFAGQMERSISIRTDALTEPQGSISPLWILLLRSGLATALAEAGHPEQALQEVHQLRESTPLPLRPLCYRALVEVTVKLGRLGEAEEAADELAAHIESQGVQLLQFLWLRSMGSIREEQGDFDAACDFYRRRIEQRPAEAQGHYDLGRCYRKMGNLNEARESLASSLQRSPYGPRSNYEMALVEDGLGHRQQALEYLHRALQVWADPDSAYAPAREAREMLRRWQRAS